MRDREKLQLVCRYLYYCDSYLYNEYISIANAFRGSLRARPEDVLELYRAKIRYEAFREFSGNLERIIYFDRGVEKFE